MGNANDQVGGEAKDGKQEGTGKRKDAEDEVVAIHDPPAKKMKCDPGSEDKESESEEPPLVKRVGQWSQKPKPKAKGKAKAKCSAKAKPKAAAKGRAKAAAKVRGKRGKANTANEPVEVVASGDEGDVPMGCHEEKEQPAAKKRTRKQAKTKKAKEEVTQSAGTDEPPKEPPVKYQPVDQQGKADLSAAYQWGEQDAGKEGEGEDGGEDEGEDEGKGDGEDEGKGDSEDEGEDEGENEGEDASPEPEKSLPRPKNNHLPAALSPRPAQPKIALWQPSVLSLCL